MSCTETEFGRRRQPFEKVLTEMEDAVFCLLMPGDTQATRQLSEIMLAGAFFWGFWNFSGLGFLGLLGLAKYNTIEVRKAGQHARHGLAQHDYAGLCIILFLADSSNLCLGLACAGPTCCRSAEAYVKAIWRRMHDWTEVVG